MGHPFEIEPKGCAQSLKQHARCRRARLRREHGASFDLSICAMLLAIMICPNCGKQTPEEDAFCGKCGQLLTASLREIVQSELQRQLSANYKDQKFVVIETAESIVERLEKWGKWFSFAIGVPVAILAATLTTIGVTTYLKGIRKIDSAANSGAKRITDAADTAVLSAENAKQEADDAVHRAESAKQEADDAFKNIGKLEEATKSARSRNEREVARVEQEAKSQGSRLERATASFEQQLESFGSRLDTVEIVQASALNASIAKSFREGDLKRVIVFLMAMGAPVNEQSTRDQLEAQLRHLGERVIADPAFREKYFQEARKAGLIK